MNLVQIRADFSGIPRSLKSRTTRLKNEKLKFFNNDKTCRYRSKQELEQEELNLFRDLVDTHAEDVKKQIDDLKELINDLKAQQMTIEGTIDEITSQKLKRQEIEWSKQIEVLTIDYDRLVEARGALANAPTSPFVWDIAFVEIFSDDKRGFDIVIGNPPYVRQENIADPKLPREEGAIQPTTRKPTKQNLPVRCIKPSRFFGYKREMDIKPEESLYPPSPTNSTPRATSTSTSISTDFPSSTPKARSVSSPLIRGWMSATEKTFRSSS